MKHYDIVIVGGGAGGMTAAIYAKRANKSVLIIEKYFAGGQMLTIDKIANYPGFELVDGFTLSQSMEKQCKELGVEFASEEVVECRFGEVEHIVSTHKNQYSCRSIIIATGARPKQLKIENEKENKAGESVEKKLPCQLHGFFENFQEQAQKGDSYCKSKNYHYNCHLILSPSIDFMFRSAALRREWSALSSSMQASRISGSVQVLKQR